MYKRKNDQPYYTNRHSCFLLQYHMVLVTKYRHPVICEDVKDELYKKIREIFEERQLVILEFNGEADHIHILYEAYPFSSPGELANVVKTQSSRYIRKLFGNTVLKKWYWKPYFWSDSYFVATVSENSLSAVRQYIQNQKCIHPRPCGCGPMDVVLCEI